MHTCLRTGNSEISSDRVAGSKIDPQCQLSEARIECSCDLPEPRRIKSQRAGTEIDGIEEIEKLGPEFDVRAFGNACPLQHAEIHLEETRRIHCIAREVAKLSGRGRPQNAVFQGRRLQCAIGIRRDGEAVGIEEEHALRSFVDADIPLEFVKAHAEQLRRVRVCLIVDCRAPRRGRYRRTRMPTDDALRLPTFERLAPQSRAVVHKASPRPDW